MSKKLRAFFLTGFTMVEIVVVLAIIVLISSVLLASFPGFNENGALLRARQEMAMDLRRLQNYALAVSNVQLEDGSLAYSPKVVGAHFDRTLPGGYLLFVDSQTGDKPNQYEAGIDSVISRTTFLRGVKLNRLYVDGSCGAAEYTTLDVVFRTPEARMTISADSLSPITCTFAKIEIKTPNLNLIRTISVWITGYIGTD